MSTKHSLHKCNIALIGFSGTGKSSVARMVANDLSFHYFDIDEEIEIRQGKPILDIFGNDGESFFRRLEYEVLKDILDKNNNVVIATGGGLVTDERCKELLKDKCFIVLLEAREDTIYQRLVNHEKIKGLMAIRPLLTGEDPLKNIIELRGKRICHYQIADWTVHTDNLSEKEVAHEVKKGWQYSTHYSVDNLQFEGERHLTEVNVPGKNYPLITGWNLMSSIGATIKQLRMKGRIVVISDSNVLPLYGDVVSSSLLKEGYRLLTYELPAGEKTKNIQTLTEIYDFLADNHIERVDVILALGGGVVGDIAGFAAATYLRGVQWIQVPTSLISLIDASIGGKTAVNHAHSKNLIGAFYQPDIVFSDFSTIKTLPRRELVSGWAEVIKYGLSLDKNLFKKIENNYEKLHRLSPCITSTILRRCMEIKSQIVAEDEKETEGKRIILNFGHTIGHALESATEYEKYLHGEAVALGMVAALKISQKLGFVTDKMVHRSIDAIDKFGLPVRFSNIRISKIIDAMTSDKKNENANINWVLLKNFGETVISKNVTDHLVKTVLKEMRQN